MIIKKSEHTALVIYKICPFCKKENKIELNEAEAAAYKQWIGGELIQNAFPNWSANEREILKTGICPDCWNNVTEDTFAHDESDDI